MKNKLTNLNDHLFEQIERLNDDSLTADQLEQEVKRSIALAGMTEATLRVAAMQLQAIKIIHDHDGRDPRPMLDHFVGTEPVIANHPLVVVRK